MGVYGLSLFSRQPDDSTLDDSTPNDSRPSAAHPDAPDAPDVNVAESDVAEAPAAEAVEVDAVEVDAVRNGKPARRRRGRIRVVAARVATGLAVLLVWFALVVPNEISRVTPGAFVRIPIEGLVLVVLALVLPRRAGRIVALIIGFLLGLLIIVKILDMGFFTTIGRPFNPVVDFGYFHSALGLLTLSVGRHDAVAALTVAIILGIAVLVVLPWAVLRLTKTVARHRTTSIRTGVALGAVWVLCAAFGATIVPGTPIASTSAAGLAYDQVGQVRSGIKDQQAFAKAAAVDPFRNTPSSDLLTGLRGKDVIFAFVESYGQVAVQGTSFSPQVDAVLNAGTSELNAAGFGSRSAFLTSPTFGGISWLAHSTLQSGLWIDNQLRYNDLVQSDRFTLSDAFKDAGWRTVGDDPSDGTVWPEATSFYHYDQVYDGTNVGYKGPNFSYASMPDQYSLQVLQNRELSAPNHPPVMAEIDLVSSHTPWTPLPHIVDPSQLGDGSIFNGMPQQGKSPATVWRSADQVRDLYGQSVQYSLQSLISFVQTSHDNNLVLVLLGDHQPAQIVSGEGANHNVPITIIAHDPAVLNAISSWGWQDGMLPNPGAPVWRMDTFRDRFLTAYDQPSAR